MLLPNGQRLEIRASKLAQFMQCAGVLDLNLPPEVETDPAREGTAAGEFLRHLLENNLQKPAAAHASNNVHFDNDMEFFTTPIAKEILSRAHSKVLCEQEVLWTTRSGIIIRGHYDASYVSGTKLVIDDLKYGWGLVEVRENWQILAYAIGEIIRRNQYFDEIELRILQPRPHHEDGSYRSWLLSYDQLLEYKEKIEARMDVIAAGNRQLTTGPKCKYCPAAGEACPAFSKAFFNGIDHVHHTLQDSLSEKQISYQLDLIRRIAELVDIKKKSLEALAIDRIKNGKVIPNYVTESNYGDRKWKKDVTPETIKIMTGIDIVEKTMLSPAKAEKAGVRKEIVNALVDRHFVGQKLKRADTTDVADRIFGKAQPVIKGVEK